MLEVTNTLTRAKEPVRPGTPGRVTMYSCGPTVYRYAHIGNLRTFLLADLVRRALEVDGTEVHQVQNITDVGHMTNEEFDRGEDRMLVSARLEDKTPAEIAEHYTRRVPGRRGRLQPAAGGRVPAGLRLHRPDAASWWPSCWSSGNAYEVDGNVYFAVESFPGYGRLSGNTLDQLRAGHRQEEPDPRKRHHADFALWKAAGPGRLVKWPSPWGDGYPGWHIECSAMSLATLGEHIDVHTGGEDNVFPHHEDEIAQSEAVVGHQVVTTWVHGRHLLTGDRKMAKSAGNFYALAELARAGPQPPGRAAAVPPGPLPDPAQLHLGRGRRGRADPRAAAVADGRLGQGPGGRPVPRLRGVRGARSGGRSTTTSTPRRPWPCCTSWRATSRCPRRPASPAWPPSTGSSASTWPPRSARPCPPGRGR